MSPNELIDEEFYKFFWRYKENHPEEASPSIAETWHAAHNHYALKLTETEVANIIMQTDIGIAGDMCISENHAMQYVKALADAGVRFADDMNVMSKIPNATEGSGQ